MIGKTLNFLGSDGVTNYFLNDRFARPNLYAGDPYYYISVTSIDGFRGADISYEAHPIPFDTGEKSGDVFRRGKTITLTGEIKALTLGALEFGADRLQETFADTSIRKLIFSRWADGEEIYINCRVIQDLAIVEEFNSFDPEWGWTVGLRADDPRTYLLSDDSLYPTWQI